MKLPQQIMIYSASIYSLVFILGLVLPSFFALSYSLAWGWLLGAVISSINYGLIFIQAARLQSRVEANVQSPYRSQGYSFARLAISASGMLACVFIEINNAAVFNLFSLFAAYLVIAGVIFITGAQLRAAKK
jgi:hypothetical protein